jgi:hypothetical protein
MATDFDVVNTAKPLGALTVQTANLIYQLQSNLAKMQGAINHSNDGTTYTVLETNFGLASGVGANFATLVGNMNNIFNGATSPGGATAQAQIVEFCSRLAGQ